MGRNLIFFLCFCVLYFQNITCQDDLENTKEFEGLDDVDNIEEAVEAAEEKGGVAVENGVLVLTEENFDVVIASEEIVLVEFYAPWCGHCKTLAPKYEEAAGQLKDSEYPVVLGKVDATIHSGLASRFAVQGYPTLKFFKNGVVQDYDGPRDADGIVAYMSEKADPNWKPPPEAVLTLTTEDFNEVINRENLILVEFYAPWCGHCKSLAPKLEKAAQQLLRNDPPIAIGKVDATVEKDLGSQYEVTGYPTMKLFRKGKAYEYKGGREEKDIVEYLLQQVEDASKEMSSVKEIGKLGAASDDVVILAVFSSPEEELYQTWLDAAADMREDYQFLHTFSADVAAHLKVSPGSIILFRSERYVTKYEKTSYVLTKADASVEEIQTFIAENDTPLVGELTTRTQQKTYSDKRPLVVMFYTVDWSFDHKKATNAWHKKLADIANKHKDMFFAVADEVAMKDLFKEFGFDDSGEEINIGILDSKQKRYPMEPFDSFDSEDVEDFLKKFNKGKLSPRIKSQPIPKKKTAVKVVVGKNFDDVVMDKSKDVLIEFYAPWCGHCKKLAPIYKELAKKYKSEKNLVIAKIDGSANEYNDNLFEVSGFPTIYFVPALDKSSPVLFEGGSRELSDFEKFIKEHATVSMGKKAGKDEL